MFSCIIISSLLLTSCSDSSSIDINYEVKSLKEYNVELDNSKIKQKYSDYQILEISSILKSKCGIIGDVVVVNSGRDDKLHLQLLKAYEDIEVIYTKDIQADKICEVDSKEDTEQLIKYLSDGISTRIKDLDIVVPTTENLKDAITKSEHKEVTLRSVLEGMNIVSRTDS